MTQSSATSSLPDSPAISRASCARRLPADWARQSRRRVRGPLLTLATACFSTSSGGTISGSSRRFPSCILTVVYAAYSGGLLPALVSVALTCSYALHYFSVPGLPLHYRAENGADLLVVSVRAAARRRAGRAGMHERVREAQYARALEPREVAGAGPTIHLPGAGLPDPRARPADFDATFRDLARLVVPTLADWCSIHLASEDGTLRFVAGAHRDPARDLVVRALAEYGERALPFEPAPLAPQVAGVTEALLRDVRRRRGGAQAVPRPAAGRGAPAAASRARDRQRRAPDPRHGRRLRPAVHGRRRGAWPKSWASGAALAWRTCRLRRQADEADRRCAPGVRGPSAADVDLRRGHAGVPGGQRRGDPATTAGAGTNSSA